MRHEIFLALLGYPADLLKNDGGEKYVHGIPKRHPCEEFFLDKILMISTQYQKLKEFVDTNMYSKEERTVKVSSHTLINTSAELGISGVGSETSIEFGERDISSETKHPGVYLQAFCRALNTELTCYRSDITAMEKKILQNPSICPFAHILAEAGHYSELFGVLNSVVLEIAHQNIRGCAIVHHLQKRLVSGSSEVITVLTSLLRQCQAVMMNQISKWLLGYLVDFHDEFFIVDLGCDGPSSFMDATTNTYSSTRMRMNKSSNEIIHYDVSMNCEMLPSCIKADIAEKILYIGKMIKLFRDDPKNVTKLGIQAQSAKLSIWGDKEDKYFLKLNGMCQTDILDELEFARVIDEMRSMVVKRTWEYFVVETDLFEEINLMKDFFLLGRGELFLEFLYKTDGVRNRPWYRQEMDKNCREAFVMAAHQVMYTNDSALRKFSVHFPLSDYKETDFELFREKDGWWHILTLKYIPKWPMHLIFTPIIIENYNKMFNFLMRVKKAQRDLHEIWLDHMQERKLFSKSVSAKVWQLRNNMMFMINNLQYYLQVDVLESQFTVMQEKMRKSRDFEEIIRVHALFQASIMSQSFLTTNKESNFEEFHQEKNMPKIECKNVVHDILLTILKLADLFCKTVSGSMSSVQLQTIDKVFIDFEFNVSFLLRYMEQLLKKTSGVNVSQLYIRLNFNDWFSKTLQMGGNQAKKDNGHH